MDEVPIQFTVANIQEKKNLSTHAWRPIAVYRMEGSPELVVNNSTQSWL